MKILSKSYMALVFTILYIPILVLILFSFNSTANTGALTGLSFYWYKELFNSSDTFNALKNTLILAISSATISTVIGTAAAVGITKFKRNFTKSTVISLTNVPMMNPDIVTGISMMLLFVFIAKITAQDEALSFVTLLSAHITFCLPYVILSVRPKILQMPKALPEAAMDLGCTPLQSFFKVEFPNILPGIISGFILAFTLSLDDFVISYFTTGNDFQTLPLLIYSMTKKEVKPDIYALSTLMILAVTTLLIISNLTSKEKTVDKKGGKKSKKAFFITALLSVVFVSGCSSVKEEAKTLNVYNWGEYISDGSEGTLDVNEEFEKYCIEVLGEEVKVNYTTYASNEDMYNKLKSGSASYDVIIPSEYMIAKMIEEEMLLKLDFSNIPNYEFINDKYKDLFFDPKNEYSVPYTAGLVGIIYNENMVSEEDVGSWDLLWNEKYKGKILQFNNPRDAFATAIFWGGNDVNTTDEAVWQDAALKLKEQKPLIQSYVMDEIFNKMKNGSAAIAPYYAGDYLTMYADNESLKFYFPKEGTNIFVDSMCIPKCTKNKELAECYINFLLSDEVAIANAEYISYTSPNDNVRNNEDYIEGMIEVREDIMDILYPDEEKIKTQYFENLDSKTLNLQNSLWEELKIENSVEPWIYILSGLIVLLLIVLLLYNYILKKIRDNY